MTIDAEVIVSNYSPVTSRDLVIAAVGDRLVARRYNETDIHPDIVVLTGQSVDPNAIPEPIIASREQVLSKKIVGTLFTANTLPIQQHGAGGEIAVITNQSTFGSLLDGARLFQVQGRSAEPIALDGQFLITREEIREERAMQRLGGELVVAIDENGAKYFKRFRQASGQFVILESLNPDGTAPSELFALNGANGLPKLTHFLPVVGILFDLPNQRVD